MSVEDGMPRAFSGPDYQRNAARAGRHNPCVLCGKGIHEARPTLVRVATDHTLHAVSTDLGARDQGCFPIGATCLKKWPALRALAEREQSA